MNPIQLVESSNSMMANVQKNSSTPTPHEMAVFNTMAEQAVSSKMYRGIGEQAGVMMIMLAARELGIPPMQALNGGLNIINGKVEFSARMMNALIRRSGHQITIKESSDGKCVLLGRRADNGDTATVSYSIEEARMAGLVKTGGGWTKNPKDMCFARALSRLARQLFSDVIGIGYVEGEIKMTDSVPILTEELSDLPIEKKPEEPEENESEWEIKYLEKFHKDDKALALEYLTKVAGHFKWSRIQTMKQMLSDIKRTFQKFNEWKSKVKT
jgi:hypothetical protein